MTTHTVRPRPGPPAAALAALLLFVLAACGGTDAADVVARAGESLEEVTSGALSVSVVTGALDGEAGDVGFEVSGPFSTADDRQQAQLTYRQFVADTEQTTTFTAVDGTAYVEVEGQAYVLDDPPPALSTGPLDGIDLRTWLIDPEVVDGEGDGRRVEATLDAPAVLRGLIALSAGGAGAAGLEELAEADADGIRAAVRTSSGVLETIGDGVFRRLQGRIDFATDLGEAVGSPGGRIEFELAIDDHGQPVEITAPASPRPQLELPAAETGS